MKKVFITVVSIAIFLTSACAAHAFTVTATSTSSGNYEDGQFTPSGSGFRARYVIDEREGTITLTKIIENDREGRFSEGDSYEIVNVLESQGPSALLVARDKKGQKIFTAVREGYMGSFETLIIGEDFYEYSNAANGRFYLEDGDVTRTGR